MTLLLIQQIADTAKHIADTAGHITQPINTQPEELRFGDLLIKGGWVMVPIGILAF